MGKKTRRSFTKEYKAEVVGLIRRSGKTVGAVCRDLGLTETAVRRWVQQAEVDSGRGPVGALTTEERAEFAALRKCVKTLEMQREIPRVGHDFSVNSSHLSYCLLSADRKPPLKSPILP